MNNHNEYLQREADYQDLKITHNPRARVSKVCCDSSSKYRLQYRNSLLGDLSKKSVLDLGCGNGFDSMNALRAGAYVTAVDISPKSIELLMTKARKENLDCRLKALVMDAHHLNFADNTFDIILGNGILHHLTDLELAVSEIKRVLKPNGEAIFLEPLGMNPFLNLFRKSTPHLRTPDEQPFKMKQLNLLQGVFPSTQLVFFDCSTLIAKVPLLLGLSKVALGVQKPLIQLDNVLLRGKKHSRVTFFQKMSWIVLIRLKKRELSE